jgi:hypothetical protein
MVKGAVDRFSHHNPSEPGGDQHRHSREKEVKEAGISISDSQCADQPDRDEEEDGYVVPALAHPIANHGNRTLSAFGSPDAPRHRASIADYNGNQQRIDNQRDQFQDRLIVSLGKTQRPRRNRRRGAKCRRPDNPS